ncbi:MAG: hypothetical protein SXA11_04395 [Cyanobacteriota bacterium]|nr:hypothetical protein [Cyanobacteriota bacterium]
MSSDKKEDICSRPDCIWKATSQNPDLYICLRCGKDKKAEPPKAEPKPKPKPNPLPTIFMALVVALVISLMFDSARSPRHQRFQRYDHHSSLGC